MTSEGPEQTTHSIDTDDFLNSTGNCTYVPPQILDSIDTALCSGIAIFGIAGNLFSILVFHRTTKLRRLTSSVYLVALAVSDTIFLTTLLLTLLTPLLKRSVFCKMIFYFMNVSGVFSSWIVVLFTVERFVVVTYPLNRMAKCSRRRARYLVSILIPIPILMYIYTALVLIDVNPGDEMCHWRPEYVFVVAVVHSVEIWLTYFIPALVVVALNLRIGLTLMRSDWKKDIRRDSIVSQQAGPLCETCVEDLDESKQTNIMKKINLRFTRSRSLKTSSSIRTTNSSDQTRNGRSKIANSSRTSNGEHSATCTLIVISTAFAVFNLPHNLVLLVKLFNQLTPQSDGSCFARGELMYVFTIVCNLLYYANFAVNIVVYHLTSCNYRQGARQFWTRLMRSCVHKGRLALMELNFLEERAPKDGHTSPVVSNRTDLQKFRLKRRNSGEMGDGHLSLIRKNHGSDKRKKDNAEANAAGYQNEPAILSTIPEADGALTDPTNQRTNPMTTDFHF